MEDSNGNKYVHKETFFQPAEYGIPSHWVVQYYVNGSSFSDAQYFNTQAEALEFERELKND